MRSKTEIIFKRKELTDLLTKVETLQYSDNETDRIIQDISTLNWVLNERIEKNSLLYNEV